MPLFLRNPLVTRISVLFALFPLLFAIGCSREQRVASHREKADAFFEAGDYERARLEYLNVTRLTPGDPLAVKRLGMIYLDQGAMLQAASILIKAAELNPQDADVRARVAKVYLGVGDRAKALEEAWAVLDIDPDHEEAVLLLVESPAVTPEELTERQQRLQGYRQRAEHEEVFLIADAVIALREGDRATAQTAVSQALALKDDMAAAHFLQASLHEMSTNLVAADQELKRAAELSPLRSNRQVRYAEFKLRTGKPDEAKALLNALTEKAPDYLPAVYVQAQIAFSEGDLDEALRLCDSVLDRYPLHLEASLLRSRVRLMRDEPSQALEELARIQNVYGGLPVYQLRVALAQVANREPNRAAATLEELVKAVPDYSEAVLLLARLHLQRGQAAEAIRVLSSYAELHPDNQAAQLMLADSLVANRQYDEGRAIYEAYSEKNPEDARGPFLVGLVLRQQGKTDEARQQFERTLEVNEQFLAAGVQLVELDLTEENMDAALKRAQELVSKAPESAGAYLLLARVQMQTDKASAEASLEKAIELDASVTGAYLMLAGLYKTSDRLVPALQQLEQLLTKSPNDVRALMLKATIHGELGQAEPARDAYEVLLASNPNFSPALNNLAYLHTEQIPDLDKAWRYGRRARELMPDSPEAADTLGWVHFKRGEFGDALRLLIEAAEKLPTEPELQYHLGMTYYMMAQETPARAAFERALQSTMDFQGKAEAQRRLDLLALDTVSGGAQARSRLEAQLKQEPNDVLALVRLADLQLKAGDAEGAQVSLDQALQVNSDLPQALVTLAELKAGEEEEDRDEALRLVRRAREAAAGDPEVSWRGGRVALQCDDPVLALALLQEAARKTGDRPDVLVDLASATYLGNRIDDALKLVQRSMQGDPGEATLKAAQELEWLIQAYQDPASAAENGQAQLTALFEREPNNVPVQMAMAGVLVKQGQAGKARDLYDKVLQQVPGLSYAHRELALLYAAEGSLKDADKAHDHAVKARQALSADPVLAKVLGMLTYERGDNRYAEQLLKEAAKGLPEDPEIQRVLEELRQ